MLFRSPRSGRARLDVYDIQGRLLATLVDSDLPAGVHRRTWTVAPSGGGLRFVRLQALGRSLWQRLVVVP